MEQVDRLRNQAVVALEALIAKHGYTAEQVDELVFTAACAAGAEDFGVVEDVSDADVIAD